MRLNFTSSSCNILNMCYYFFKYKLSKGLFCLLLLSIPFIFSCAHQQKKDSIPADISRFVLYKHGLYISRNPVCDDLNNDGLVDIAVVEKQPQLNIFFNSPQGLKEPLKLQTNTHNTYLTSADMDNDGNKDLIPVTEALIGPIFYNKSGTFTPVEIKERTPAFGFFITSGDLDNDGRKDLVVLGLHRRELKILFNEGNNSFLSKTFTPPAVSVEPVERRFIENWTGAGTTDIGTGIEGFVESNRGQFKAAGTGGGFREAIIYDINHDGLQDLIIADYFGRKLLVAINKGERNFSFEILYEFASTVSSCRITEVKNKHIIAVALESTSKVALLECDVSLNCKLTKELTVTGYPQRVVSADLDNDGNKDFLISIMSGMTGHTLLAIYNPGTESMRTETTFLPKTGCDYLSVCDIYSEKDIICSDTLNRQMVIFKNEILHQQ
jgi:hypothetical protein